MTNVVGLILKIMLGIQRGLFWKMAYARYILIIFYIRRKKNIHLQTT